MKVIDAIAKERSLTFNQVFILNTLVAVQECIKAQGVGDRFLSMSAEELIAVFAPEPLNGIPSAGL